MAPMKISSLENAPAWLLAADTRLADVELCNGAIIWHGGDWHGGEWRDGIWHGGDWHGGEWHDGIWHGGDWHGGIWHGGEWRDGDLDRLLFMASFIGIVFGADGCATAYRTTMSDGTGRHNREFIQIPGGYREEGLPPSGSGTCVKGIHVTSAGRAWTYFGVEPTAKLWRVRFTRADLLDCDGEKARIAGGLFEEIPTPWL